MRTTGLVAALVVLVVGCGPSASDEVDLGQVSQEIQFQSVDNLGPHKYLASVARTESRAGQVAVESVETFEITWQGWDDFEVRRTVDGDPAGVVRVAAGEAWVEKNGKWQSRGDAEPYRQELRATWSGWDQALDAFRGRVDLLEAEDGVVEGRPARRYTVALRPEPKVGKAKAKRQAREGGPTAIEGFVWVDQTTAVRLVADVTGTVQRGDVMRTTHLKLARSGIGQDQGIEPPPKARADRAPILPVAP